MWRLTTSLSCVQLFPSKCADDHCDWIGQSPDNEDHQERDAKSASRNAVLGVLEYPKYDVEHVTEGIHALSPGFIVGSEAFADR